MESKDRRHIARMQLFDNEGDEEWHASTNKQTISNSEVYQINRVSCCSLDQSGSQPSLICHNLFKVFLEDVKIGLYNHNKKPLNHLTAVWCLL